MNRSTIFTTITRLLIAGLAAGLTAASAVAQAYPTKPVTLVVPFSAGSPTDIAARAFGEDLSKELKTPVLVDNRPGGSQTIAASQVWRAPADGYTLLFVNVPGVVAPSIQAKLPYRSLTDFSPLSNVMSVGLLLATAPGVPARNLQEFIALLREKPSEFTYGSSGIGSTIHLAAEIFNKQVGVSTVHVPYKGAQQVVQDLSAGVIQYAFVAVNAMEFARVGKLKALGLTSSARDAAYPEVPTLTEAGLPGLEAKAYFLLVGPKGLRPEIVERVNAAANKVLLSPTFAARARSLGGVTVSAPSPSSEVGLLLQREVGRWEDVVKSANIRLE